MDVSFTLGRLGTKMAEIGQVARYRSRQTTDVMEECLVAWRDSQAQRFAVAIEEPQRDGFEPLRRALTSMEDSLKNLETHGGLAEQGAARVQSVQHEVHRSCRFCENNLSQAKYYIADARDRASQARSTAERLESQVAALGEPPV